MPIDFGIWRVDQGASRLTQSSLASEAQLEAAIKDDISLIDPDLLLIGQQIRTEYGKLIDLLAVNQDGDLVVIELKRDRTPREVVAQAIDYASWIQTLSFDRIIGIYSAFAREKGLPHQHFEEAFANAFGASPPDTLNENHQLLIVASELDDATERIVNYLATVYGVPINVAFFRYFHDAGRDYLARAWLIDRARAEASSAGKASAKAQQPWNGQDYYVSFGVGDRRTWDDARRYGFISAGGGKWYIQTLKELIPGKRVFVHIPGEGYVGVGEVTDTVKPLHDFRVNVNGTPTLIQDAPLQATNVTADAGDPDAEEHFVRIHWIETRSRDQAVWEKGFFANQNTACKLRNRYTLDLLAERFDLGDTTRNGS